MDDWELIISDDGSTDGTVEYLQSLSDERIRVYVQPQNLGIFGNLNFLFTCAESPITQILCQDDFLIGSDALEKILTIWEDLPKEAAFLRCNHWYTGASGMVRLQLEALPTIIDPKDSDFYFFIFGCIPGNLSNVSVRTQIVAQMGWYRTDLPYSGDFEFWSRTGRAWPWALSKSNVVQVRTHMEQASVTLNRSGELLPQLGRVVQGLYDALLAQGYAPLGLRITATVSYVAQHIDAGLRRALKGNGWGYLWLVNESLVGNACFLGKWSSWLIYVISGGGRILGPTMAKHLISRHTALLKR
jgi:glycosyltransferase involved in cell wall biosynthesis